MAQPNPTDPFTTAESDLSTLLSTTRSLLHSYTRIRATSPSPTSPELLSARQDLTTSLEDLTADLQDLIDAVKAVEGDPYRYGLDVAEVERRRDLVRRVGEEVALMQGEARSSASASGTPGLPNPEAFAGDDDDDEGEDGEEGGGYNEFEEQRQQEMLEEQDEALDGVFRTVGNLRLQADEMGRELEEQGELLDSVDGLADRVGGKLNEGVKRIGWVIRKNEDAASSCCIGVLIVVLIVLLLLVLLV